MIEVAVAIAVIAILAGAAVPLVLKALDQQREQRTRGELKLLFEALFGARDRAVPNMHSDFGYAGILPLSSWVTQRPAAATVRAYAAYLGADAALSGGWRGPYYNGNVNAAGVPQDPWGDLYVLRSVPGFGWQVLSWGANRANNTAAGSSTPQGDDLAYPLPPQPLQNGTVSANIYKVGGGVPASVAIARVLSPGATGPIQTTLSPLGGNLYKSAVAGVPSGPVVVYVRAGSPTLADQYQAVDLPSGGSVTLNFYVTEP